jgi:hypothetical protein
MFYRKINMYTYHNLKDNHCMHNYMYVYIKCSTNNFKHIGKNFSIVAMKKVKK